LLAASLALLIQMVLAPVLHRAVAAAPDVAAVHRGGGHHAGHQAGEAGTPDGAHQEGHQICHFCRFASTVLAPPTPAGFAPPLREAAPAWQAAPGPVALTRTFLCILRVRAPPASLPA
jgi:hypothetical protein